MLRAVRAALDERMIRRPHVIGRLEVVTRVAANLNLGFKVIERSRADAEQSLSEALPKESVTDDGLDILRVVDMSTDAFYVQYADTYHSMMGRQGVPPAKARYLMRTNSTVAAAMMVACGHAQAMISGVAGKLSLDKELEHVQDIIGLQCGVRAARTLDLLVIPGRGPFFFAGTRGSGDSRRQGRMGRGLHSSTTQLNLSRF